MKPQTSEQEIDAAFEGTSGTGEEPKPASVPFDFNRRDQISKSHLQAFRLLHENFARSLASSLSSFMATEVLVQIASIEQISYSKFAEGITPPACIAYVRMAPSDRMGVLDFNTTLLLNLVELMLGGSGKWTEYPRRKITEIEEALVQILVRIILRDLGESWKTVTNVNFSIQSMASEPQWLHVLEPAEGVVVIAVEVKIGANSGLLNLALPSIFVKGTRDQFEQLRQVRRSEPKDTDQRHVSNLIQASQIQFEATLTGGTITLEQFLNLNVNDVVILGSGNPNLEGFLNGCKKWNGRAVAVNSKRAFQIGD